jgi:hypothetical protein
LNKHKNFRSVFFKFNCWFQTKRLPVNADFDAEKFIKSCPSNLSGADFYALTNRARQNALKRLIEKLEGKKNEPLELIETDDDIFLDDCDFEKALVGFQPTLSESAFLEYEKYFKNYSTNNRANK